MSSALRPTAAHSAVAHFAGTRPARAGLWPLLARVLHLRALRRSRLQLARLDARLLCDIGVTATEAKAETGRVFWDAPGHWRG